MAEAAVGAAASNGRTADETIEAGEAVYAGADASAVAARLDGQRDDLSVAATTGVGETIDAVAEGVECVLVGDRSGNEDPLDLLAAVRERDPDLPVVLVPADGEESLAAAAVAAGATDYLPHDGDLPAGRVADRAAAAVADYRRVRRRRRERAFLERLRETAAGAALVVDREGEVAYADDRAAEHLNLEGTPLDDSDVHDADGRLIPPADRPHAEVFATGDPVTDVRCQVDLGGERRWLSVDAEPVVVPWAEEDPPQYVAVTATDITEGERYRRRLEEAREGLETELAEVFERVSDAFFALDSAWRFTYVNERAAALIGVDAAGVVGESIWETFPEAVGTTFEQQYREAMATQEAVAFEEYYEPLDTWFEVRAYPSETGLSVYFRDVTERKARDEALQRAYEIFVDAEMGFDAKVQALLELGRETVGTDYGSLSHVEGDDYTFEAVAAPPDADLAPGDTIDLGATNCERAIQTDEHLVLADVDRDAPDLAGRWGNAEWGISAYLGTPVTVGEEAYGTFCFYDMDARESFADWKVTFVDVLSNWVGHELERQRRQRDLERTERQFRAAFDNPHSFMTILDPDGTVRQVNEVALEFIDRDHEDVVGEPFPQTPWWDHSPALQERLRGWIDRAADGEYVRFEEEHVADGETVTVDGVLHPVTDEAGTVTAIFVTGRDISERKARERQLERQREHLDALNDLNSLVQGIGEAVVRLSSREEIEQQVCEALADSASYAFAWIGDAEDGRLVTRAEAGVEGYLEGVDAPVGEEAADGPAATSYRIDEMQVVGDVRTDPRFAPRRHLADEHGFRSVGCVPVSFEGTVYGVLCVYSARANAFGEQERAVFERLGTIIAHAIRSVERERELRERERRYRTMAENIPNGTVALVDRDRRYRLAAGEAFDSLDVDAETIVGERLSDVSVLPEPSREASIDAIERALDGEAVSTELTYGDRTFAYHAIPVEDDGEVHAAMSLSQEVTERVRREAELEHERERLELLNRLIRHNLLNSLNVVEARLGLLEGHVDPEADTHLETALTRTREMIDLIETIRALMRTIADEQTRDLEPVPIADLLRAEVRAAAEAFPEATFETGTLPDAAVLADDLLAEAFENLLVNAVQHNDAATPRVRVDVEADTDSVVVEVADNGPGVPEDLRKEIFDKGTKGFESPGTGFGLHLVREIVDAYGGEVTVRTLEADDAPPGLGAGGACFRVELPRP